MKKADQRKPYVSMLQSNLQVEQQNYAHPYQQTMNPIIGDTNNQIRRIVPTNMYEYKQIPQQAATREQIF